MNKYFLLNLKLSGVKNIEKPIEIPFYKKTIKNDFDPDQYRIKGIYGENGSGKTAIMTAISILTKIITDKSYLANPVNQTLMVDAINRKTKHGFIEVMFYSYGDGTAYIYKYRIEFEVRQDENVYLTKEQLDYKKGHNSQTKYNTIYEASNGVLNRFELEDVFEFSKAKTQNLLEKRSFETFLFDIEKETKHTLDPVIFHMYDLFFFAFNIHVILDGEDDHRQFVVNSHTKNDGNTMLREAYAIEKYMWIATAPRDKKEVIIPKLYLSVYTDKIKRLSSFIHVFKTGLVDIKLDTKDHGEYYICRRIMVYDGYELDEEYESRGIKKLMGLFDALDAACTGSIVFIDELDSNINDVYLSKILEYFLYYGKGQLCFTAHNLSPMSVLRNSKCAISFISSVNTVHTWTTNGNLNPEHAYREGFIEDSPFNVEASDFLGILGGTDE